MAILIYTPILMFGHISIDYQLNNFLVSKLSMCEFDNFEAPYLGRSIMTAVEMSLLSIVLIYLQADKELSSFFDSQRSKKSKDNI